MSIFAQSETRVTGLTDLPAWRALCRHRDELETRHLSDLFAADSGRAAALTAEAAGLEFDFSRQRITRETVDGLVALARERHLSDAIRAMFAGEAVNRTEARAAWHVALRAPRDTGYSDEVHAVLDEVDAFAEAVRSGAWRGFSGAGITDVVNIGIGGSDLGPRLVCEALAPDRPALRAHFVANVDPAALDDVLVELSPETTLFVVASKSFTTAETLANARVAREWLQAAGADSGDIARHFVAVTARPDAAAAFGIERTFGFWDWVGGRFSLWSAAGLPIVLSLGMDAFRSLLAGAHMLDEHFRCTPLERNLPVLMGLVGIWNRNFLGLPSQAVVPYAQRLARFVDWLQQLEMESNGKHVDTDGDPVAVATAPAVWGAVGTNAQHAFFQMLHQGSEILPTDFVLPLSPRDDPRQTELAANCAAQAEALMHGRQAEVLRAQGGDETLVPHRACPGNRPSSIFLMPSLDAHHLGALLAACEHKMFVQGVIWGINSFDQWGVELGKTLATRILAELDGELTVEHDAATAALVGRLRTRFSGESP